MVTLRKRGSTWHIDYYVGNRRIRRSTGWKSYRRAKAYADDLAAELRLGIHKPPADVLLVDFLEDFLDHQKQVSRKPKTRKDQRHQLERFIAYLPTTRVGMVTRSHISAFLDSLGLSKATRNRYRAAISRFMAYAIECEVREDNPVRKVPQEKEARRAVTALTQKQRELVLESVRGSHLEVPAALACFAGLRRGELAGLRWANIDMKGGWLVVPETIAKNGEARELPMNARLVAVLDGKRRRSAFVCLNSRGKPWSRDGLSQAFRRLGERLGLPILNGPHVLRRTFGTHLADLGAGHKEVQERMGHKDPTTTMRYLKRTEGSRGKVDEL